MVITIDGPAGSGKSSVARQVAQRLGFGFLDTGAMYRAIGLEAVRRATPLDDPRQIAFVARHCHIEFDWSEDPPQLLLNGEPVSHLLRGQAATDASSHVATVPQVRQMLVALQRQIGQTRGDIVTEGRDQGSVVFPDAQVKVYLDADPAERARRRAEQLRSRGEIVDIDLLRRQMSGRDQRDTSRATDPLTIAADAVRIDTTQMDQAQVVARIIELVNRARC